MLMRFADRWMTALLLDEPGEGGSGGDANGKPAGGGDVQAGANKPAGNAAAQGNERPAQAAGNKTPEPSDRERGLLADLQKERKARQQFEAQVQQAQAEIAQERRRVQALAGVNPRSQEDTDLEEVRARLIKVFPALGKLTEEQVDKILGVADKAEALEEGTLQQMTRHGRTMLDSVLSGVKKALGGELSERQIQKLERAYVAEAEASPEFLQRHNMGDQSLIEQFVKEYVEDWFEPARRRVTADEVARQRKVPSARDRSVVGQGGKKIDVNDPKAFGDALVESFRSHGGAFGE